MSSDCLKVHAQPFCRVRKEKVSFDRINSALTINTFSFKLFVVVVVCGGVVVKNRSNMLRLFFDLP